MKYLINSFTQKMLDLENHTIQIETTSKKEVMQNKDQCISAIGHSRLAKRIHAPVNRMMIQLEKGDIAYIIHTRQERKNTAYPTDNYDEKMIYQKLTVVE